MYKLEMYFPKENDTSMSWAYNLTLTVAVAITLVRPLDML